MADFNALEALINAYIKQNGVQAITGNVLNGVLRGMVSALGKGWTIADGDATPTMDPGTMTGPVAYIAHTAGTYEHFGNLVVNDGEVVLLKYNEQTWTKEVIASLAATATIDGNIGTPSVGVSWVNGVLTFDFHNLKGVQGDTGNTGAAAGFGTPTATVDANVGTPGVSVSASGPDTAKVFSFQFTNLKGEQGIQGIQGPEGPTGPTGPTGVTSVVVTVDNTSGNPACTASLSSGVLTLAFTGLKGAQGDTGSSVAYPFTLVNNLTTDDATQALSAAMGVQLESEISQLEHEVHNLSGKYYGVFEDDSDLPEGDATGYAFVGTESPFSIWNFDGEGWADSGSTVDGITGEPGVGFESAESPTPADGTFNIHLTNGDTITVDMNHNHPAYYSKVLGGAQPVGGFEPDVVYSLGTLSGTITFSLASPVTGNVNHYFWMFDTSSTAPTITWPVGITWAAGSAPTVAASKHYEISILGGVAYYSEV